MKILLAFLAGVGGMLIYWLMQPKARMLGYILLLIIGAGIGAYGHVIAAAIWSSW